MQPNDMNGTSCVMSLYTAAASRDVLADTGFLCDEAAVLRDTIKGTFRISSESKVVFRG
jgi:hypothetical protein